MLRTHPRLPSATIAQVEAEGKLYSIPDGVKMVRPGSEGKEGKWWKVGWVGGPVLYASNGPCCVRLVVERGGGAGNYCGEPELC